MTAAFLGILVFEFAGCAAVLAQFARTARSQVPEPARQCAGIAAYLVVAGFGFLLWSKAG